MPSTSPGLPVRPPHRVPLLLNAGHEPNLSVHVLGCLKTRLRAVHYHLRSNSPNRHNMHFLCNNKMRVTRHAPKCVLQISADPVSGSAWDYHTCWNSLAGVIVSPANPLPEVGWLARLMGKRSDQLKYSLPVKHELQLRNNTFHAFPGHKYGNLAWPCCILSIVSLLWFMSFQ